MTRARILPTATLAVSLLTTVGCGSSSTPTTNTKVTLTNSSTSLSYSADLHSSPPTKVPGGTAMLTLDWGSLGTNALGRSLNMLSRTSIDHAIVGHYTQSVSDLEHDFLNLQSRADKLYQADIESGTVLDFKTLMDSSGNAFTGIDASGTWIVALECTYSCRNPAPWYLTILQPDNSASGTVIAAEANNYKFTSSLTLHPVKVKQKSDLTVDWGGVTQDFLGQPVDPKKDLNQIFLLAVGLPAADLAMQLNNDTFSSSSIVIPGPPPSYPPENGETSKSLVGNFITPNGTVMQSDLDTYLDASKYPPSTTTFAFAAQTGESVGSGDARIRMLQSFELE
jgi:hypothetical protein